MRGAATIAIVTTRLYMERRPLILCMCACALLAYLQRYDRPDVRLAGALIFGTLVAMAVASIQRGSGRLRQIELCEQSAPLYGRELARATALVPCIITSASLGAYWIVASSYAPAQSAAVVLSFIASNAVAVAALRATLAAGAGRAVWIALSCAAAGGAYALNKAPIAIATGACCLLGFIALRQYGEALARYDPLDRLGRGSGGQFL